MRQVTLALLALTMVCIVRVHGAAPVPEVRTLHWRHTHQYSSETLKYDVWLDVERGFLRERYKGTAKNKAGRLLNDGDTFHDDEFVTVIYHGDLHVHHWRTNPLTSLAYARLRPDDFCGRMRVPDPFKIPTVKKTGQEKRNEVLCDVWEGPIPQVNRPQRVAKFWIAAATGVPMRIEQRNANPEADGKDDWTMEMVEINPALPAGFFRAPLEIPKGYDESGPRETSEVTGFTTSGYGSGDFSLEQVFILPGGSALIAWNSGDRPLAGAAFAELKPGDHLPETPTKLLSVRTLALPDGDIDFDPRHVGVTTNQKGETLLWTLLVPARPLTAEDRFAGYVFEHESSQQSGNIESLLITNGMPIEHKADFDTFVRGVMGQMSTDGEPPSDATFETVVDLAQHPRKVRGDARTIRADPNGL